MKTVMKEYASFVIALLGTVFFLELMWEFLFSIQGLFVKMIALVGNGGIG